MLGDHCLNRIQAQAAHARNARRLVGRSSQADVGVEPTSGRGDQVNRHRQVVTRISCAQGFDAAFDSICQRGVVGTQI